MVEGVFLAGRDSTSSPPEPWVSSLWIQRVFVEFETWLSFCLRFLSWKPLFNVIATKANADFILIFKTAILYLIKCSLTLLIVLFTAFSLEFEEFAIVWSDSMADSDNDSGGHNNNAGSELSPREQDRFLPIANVSRIMKKALPANAKISKDAKETVQECVSEFISFITGEASDKCQREKRKTINGDDLLWAMTTLGFEDYVDPLKIYLHRFREMEGEKTSMGRQGEKDGPSAAGGNGSVVNPANTGSGGFGETGMYGAIPSTMMMMGHHQHQGHVYGSSAYHPMAAAGANFGSGKANSGHPGSGPSAGRPR